MIRSLVALACVASLSSPAAAMVGGARPAAGSAASAVVFFAGTRGTFCTGTAIARDLILTAAHCIKPGASYRLMIAGGTASSLPAIRSITVHPSFDAASYARARATADVALIKLADALPASITPALAGGRLIGVGERFLVAGYGLAVDGDDRSIGTLRSADLIAVGNPSALQLRLADPATKNTRPGLGACAGDSGAPAFEANGGRLTIIGVVSWSTAAKNAAGCGGLTGITPLQRYRGWIVETAAKLGSALP